MDDLTQIKINNNLDCLVIVGATATGKSQLAVVLAQKYNGEIISADAYQVYQKMDIGTAKINSKDKKEIPHYLIDTLDYQEEYNVMIFQKMAREKIQKIKNQKKLPIIVGGTNLYIQALLDDYHFIEHENFAETKNKNEQKSLIDLQKIIDFHQIKLNESEYQNHKRLVTIVTKIELKIYQSQQRKKYYQNYQILGIYLNKKQLYDKINSRVDQMVIDGLIEEVMQFDSQFNSQQAIGYKEIHQYLDNKITKEQAIELIKKNSRNLAKRQMTWLNNQLEIKWYQLVEGKWQLMKN